MKCIDDKMFPEGLTKTQKLNLLQHLIQNNEVQLQDDCGTVVISLHSSQGKIQRILQDQAEAKGYVKKPRMIKAEINSQNVIKHGVSIAYEVYNTIDWTDKEKIRLFDEITDAWCNGVLMFAQHYNPKVLTKRQ
jgi:hypothetical protein